MLQTQILLLAVDDENQKLTAHINIITDEQLQSIGVIDKSTIEIQ